MTDSNASQPPTAQHEELCGALLHLADGGSMGYYVSDETILRKAARVIQAYDEQRKALLELCDEVYDDFGTYTHDVSAATIRAILQPPSTAGKGEPR